MINNGSDTCHHITFNITPSIISALNVCHHSSDNAQISYFVFKTSAFCETFSKNSHTQRRFATFHYGLYFQTSCKSHREFVVWPGPSYPEVSSREHAVFPIPPHFIKVEFPMAGRRADEPYGLSWSVWIDLDTIHLGWIVTDVNPKNRNGDNFMPNIANRVPSCVVGMWWHIRIESGAKTDQKVHKSLFSLGWITFDRQNKQTSGLSADAKSRLQGHVQ